MAPSDNTGALPARSPHLRLVDVPEPHASARALIDEARALDKLGSRAEARELYERALHALDSSSPAMASMLLRWIARSYEVDANYEAAADCAEAAVATAELSDDRNALGHALNVLAAAKWRLGELTEAEQLFHEALERGTSTTDPRLQVDVNTNLGSLAKIRGDFREALRYYQSALALGRGHSLLDNILVALNNLALTNMDLGRLDAAEETLNEALTIANALGGLSYRIQLEVNYAQLQIDKGDLVEAKRRCDRGMTLAAHLKDTRANGEAERVYGVIARESGDLATAEAHLGKARDIAAAAGDMSLEGRANCDLAELFGKMGRNRETLRALNRAHICYSKLSARHALADVGRRMSALEGDFLDVVRQWGVSIESKDIHTQGHCERVADLAGALAAKVGLDETSLFWFRIGALLHDVGKLIVPAEVLNKTGKLTDEEWNLMKQHPAAGVEMLADVEFPWDVAPMVRSHHERWDGRGYPDGLAAEAIPLPARILCIADVYDALTSERSYKRAFSHLEAMEIMRRDVGRQFDPALFVKFEELVRRGTASTASAKKAATPAGRSKTPISATVSEDDDLTGALLRKAFVNVTSAVLAERRRTGAPVSLLVVDVDQFKSVNDTYGHLTGDDALKLVAGVMREQMRPGQYVGRYAGDEFVALLPGLDADAARAVAEDIRRATSASPVPVRESIGQFMSVTLSIGVATAPAQGENFESLFTAADRALFDAKREGRDKVVVAGSLSDGPQALSFSRFVGRTQELRALVGALDDSVQGLPQLRVLIGEAGVGKSTLVRQLLPELRLRGAVMVTGRALDSESRPPYGPWAEVVLALHELGLSSKRQSPLLERLVPALRGNSDEPAVPQPFGAAQGHAFLQELVVYLRSASESRPITVVLEDMHWADAASWDGLEFILAQLANERICIALTLRAEEAAYGAVKDRRQKLSRDERTRELRIERLTSAEVREWLQGALHRTDLGDDLMDFVLRHTEGNPFLVLQLLRALVEENVFTYTNGAWTWAIPKTLALPAGMSDLVGRRLSRLPQDALRILVTAAAIGRVFPIKFLASAANVSMDAVLDAIDSGLASSVIEPAHDEDDDTYQFAHALLVDIVLKSVSPARQRLTHERIADLLAMEAPSAIDRIASHYARSGNGKMAYSSCRAAAAQAMLLYAVDEATDFLNLALSHATVDAERVTVYNELARTAELSGRWADVEKWCDEMLATPDFRSEPAQALPVQQRQLNARLRLGQGTEHIEAACRQLLAVAEGLDQASLVVHTRDLLAQALLRLGRIDEGIEVARESLRLAEASGDEALMGEAMRRLASSVSAVHPAETIDLSRRLRENARLRNDRVMEANAFLLLGVAHLRTRDDASAAEAYRTALALARDVQALDLAGIVSSNLGLIEMRSGNFAAAQEAFTDALRVFTTLRNNTNRLIALYNLANLEGERGDAETALSLYREAAELANRLAAADIEIGAHSGCGLASLRLLDMDGARSALQQARLVLGDRDDWWFQGRERLESLAIRIDAADGKIEDASARFQVAVEHLEAVDVYPAAWLVADCAADLIEKDASVIAAVHRFATHETVQQYVPLAARFTALRDAVDRHTDSRGAKT